MDYLDELGNLALGSRLKRLSERLHQEVTQVYKEQGIAFEPRWFPVFRFIAEHGCASVTDIALGVGVTHPAVNQISEELSKADLILSITDRGDKRKRILSLSTEGKRIKQLLDPTWKVLHAALSDVSEEIQSDLVNMTLKFENALNKRNLAGRFASLKGPVLNAIPTIVEYEAAYAHHFARLNRVWIEKFFYLEQEDLRVLGDPQKIIDDGGFIFFALVGEKVVGTCALLKVDGNNFELVKMAVDEAYRGHGLGRLLLEASIEKARAQGARELRLETNSVLKAAVRLYHRMGFVETKSKHDSKFSRVDMVMSLDLQSSADTHPQSAPKSHQGSDLQTA